MTSAKSTALTPLYAMCLISTLLALNTCLHIEYWNARAGGLLPRTLPTHGNPKWRVAARSTERKFFYRQLAFEDADRMAEEGRHLSEGEFEKLQSETRVLTPKQQAELDQLLEKNEINNSLQGWVAFGGLLQYLIAPVAMTSAVLLLILAKSRWARLAVLPLAACSGYTLVMMWHREYFTSLGW